MAVLWQMGQASVEDIRQRLEGRPAASTVRSLLAIMAERGLVADDNTVYAKKYRPKLDQGQAQDSALRRVIDRLFSGSTEELLVRLIDEGAVDSAQLERLQKTPAGTPRPKRMILWKRRSRVPWGTPLNKNWRREI